MSGAALDDVFRAIDLIGVFANAALGGVIARKARLDPIGFGVLALLSGLGGGVIRDTLLQHGPPVALTDYAYVLTALGAAALSFVVNVEGRLWNRAWPVIDAIALGAWSAAGAQKTLAVGLGWLPAILLGTITAVGGGLVRDVVLGRTPGILGGNTLYATCAIAASAVMVLFKSQDASTAGLIVATLVGASLVLLARWRGWTLPSSDAWAAAVPERYRRLPRDLRQRRPGRRPQRP